MTMITPSYLGETIEYSSLHACRSTLEDPKFTWDSGNSDSQFPVSEISSYAQSHSAAVRRYLIGSLKLSLSFKSYAGADQKPHRKLAHRRADKSKAVEVDIDKL